MEYRRLKKEELFSVKRMSFFAFSGAFGGVFDEQKTMEDIENGMFDNENRWGAVDGNGNVVSSMRSIPYEMIFDGNIVPMSGIASVTSLPENRRGGHIKNIFKAILNDEYEKGVVFSHLYPFSYDYYRKFGYEAVGAATEYTLPIPEPNRKSQGEAIEYIKGMPEREALVQVYDKFASGYNCMINRDEQKWDSVLTINNSENERVYFWKNNTGEIKAWIKFSFKKSCLKVIDYAWTDIEGMLGIIDFLGMFSGAVEKLTLIAAEDFSPELFWTNIHEIDIKLKGYGMSRVLNAKKALELMKKPEKTGGLIIKISDAFAEWNNKTYKIEYGGSQCSVNETSAEADIEVNERALTQLVLGYKGINALSVRGDIVINSNTAEIKELFTKKYINITDRF